jgi:mRNA-degrading endonuclease toxin of MazEF toxin-antitoxin module
MASRRTYVPEAGDIVWLQFDPQAGHEQAGHRPALVLSPAIYNSKTSDVDGGRSCAFFSTDFC